MSKIVLALLFAMHAFPVAAQPMVCTTVAKVAEMVKKHGEMECRAMSQEILAEWQGYHPKRKIARYACVPEKRIGFYIGRNQA